jgi:hypothetical protein
MVEMTGLNRKYIIQLMRGDLARKRRQRQRGRSYGPEVEEVLLVVAESLDFVCGKRLQPVLLATAQQLARHGEIVLSSEMEASSWMAICSTSGHNCGLASSYRGIVP